jgi:hypothetical protein
MAGSCCRIFCLVAFAAVLFISLPGCSKERVYQGVYEGVRMNDDAGRESTEPERMPTYDAYQRDRLDIIEDHEPK